MGLPLACAADWLNKRSNDLNASHRLFISLSVDVEDKKQAQAQILRDQALTMQSRFLADMAAKCCAGRDYATAIALALEALPDERRGIARPYTAAAESVLYQS
jgi:hypothetical protein